MSQRVHRMLVTRIRGDLQMIAMAFTVLLSVLVLSHLRKARVRLSLAIWAKLRNIRYEYLYWGLASLMFVGLLVSYLGLFCLVVLR